MRDALDQVRAAVKLAENEILKEGDSDKYIVYDPTSDNWKVSPEQPAVDVAHFLVKSLGQIFVHSTMNSPDTYVYRPASALGFSGFSFSYSKEF